MAAFPKEWGELGDPDLVARGLWEGAAVTAPTPLLDKYRNDAEFKKEIDAYLDIPTPSVEIPLCAVKRKYTEGISVNKEKVKKTPDWSDYYVE